MSEIKAAVKDYWTNRSSDFADLKRDELHSEKYDRWLAKVSEYLPENKCLKILDVGCGCGFFTIMLSKMGHDVIGVDLTESMIEEGRKLAEEEGAAAAFCVMDAEHLDFEDETFDVVISRNLTWTLPHPKEAYNEWLRVLKKGGVIINFDGEYAKDHHQNEEALPAAHAHSILTDQQKQKCHQIYHMMEISVESRPAWDVQTLQQLGAARCEVEFNLNNKIYREKDKFYISANVFAVKAWKTE